MLNINKYRTVAYNTFGSGDPTTNVIQVFTLHTNLRLNRKSRHESCFHENRKQSNKMKLKIHSYSMSQENCSTIIIEKEHY